MNTTRTGQNVVFSDLGILILLALARRVLHTLTNGRYGWRREELSTLDDALPGPGQCGLSLRDAGKTERPEPTLTHPR